MRCEGNPDTATDTHASIEIKRFGTGIAGRRDVAEPQRTRGAKVDAVDATVDVQRLGKPARTAREIVETICAALALHLLGPFDRLKRADQHSTADSGEFGADIEHEVIAI
jgi:hypothetical protein